MNNIIVFLIAFIFSTNVFCQGITKSDTINFFCGGYNGPYSLKTVVPKGYQLSEWRYTEGYFKTFTYSDSSIITIHCGSSIKIPILNDKALKIISKTEKSRKGIDKINGKYWREDNFGVANIYYKYVSNDHLYQYDLTFDSFKIVRIEQSD